MLFPFCSLFLQRCCEFTRDFVCVLQIPMTLAHPKLVAFFFWIEGVVLCICVGLFMVVQPSLILGSFAPPGYSGNATRDPLALFITRLFGGVIAAVSFDFSAFIIWCSVRWFSGVDSGVGLKLQR